MKLNHLTDDSLILVLLYIPVDQLLSKSLACKRWYSLFDAVNRKRTSLVLHASYGLRWFPIRFFLFHDKQSVSTAAFTKYFRARFNLGFRKPLPTLTDVYNEDCLAVRDISLSLCPVTCVQFSNSFSNLKHLSLMNVSFNHEALIGLLGYYKDKLESLHLCVFNLPYDSDANLPLWSLIDSMSSLRILTIQAYSDNFSTLLATVLPQLEELNLINAFPDVFSILERLNGNKLRRLTFDGERWHDPLMLSRLAEAKPGLSGLTHLKIVPRSILGLESTLTESLLGQIGTFFPELRYLDISTTVRNYSIIL